MHPTHAETPPPTALPARADDAGGDLQPDATETCCPACGHTDLSEVPVDTARGRSYVLRCDNDACAVVVYP